MERSSFRISTKPSTKPSISIVLIIMLLASLLQACGNTKEDTGAKGNDNQSNSNIPKVLNFGYIGTTERNLPSGAEGWGFHKGIIQEELKKYGIEEVVLTGFPNGPDQTESLISGRIDIGSLGDTPGIIAYASGVKSKVILQGQITNVAYLVTTADGPKTLEELEGKTIAIQKGSYMHRYVAGLLKDAGIKDVKLVHMLNADGQAALARGDVDAMTNSGIATKKLLDNGYHLIDSSKDHPELHGTNVTVVSENYLEKFPDINTVWINARAKALEDLKQNEEEYYQFVADLNKTTVEIAKEIYPISEIASEPFTEEGVSRLTGTKGFLVEEGLAKKDYDIGEWLLR